MSRTSKTLSPQLRALGPTIRLLWYFIDAWADHNWGTFETALLAESDNEEGWNLDSAERQMREWGARDQYGIYNAAGLTERQAEVAFLFFDRQLEPKEIAGYLGIDAVTVRVHLHKVEERLRRLAA